jgi:hypothetical protein
MVYHIPGTGTLAETTAMLAIGEDATQTVFEFRLPPPVPDRLYPQGRKSKRGQRRAARRWP